MAGGGGAGVPPSTPGRRAGQLRGARAGAAAAAVCSGASLKLQTGLRPRDADSWKVPGKRPLPPPRRIEGDGTLGDFAILVPRTGEEEQPGSPSLSPTPPAWFSPREVF
uniref:Suppressor of cytokine signaling 2 isoform X2 n=1 Tax=Phascolarctos cinereus TaxID=38626 RepID=A0A6P5LUA6_PHACI|nr:suppressor of cytokine signaling 2 isoform X2 [Phascolarctos cinereus]